MASPLQILEAWRRGEFLEGTLYLLALQSIDETNAESFPASLTGCESRGLRDFVETLSNDEGDRASVDGWRAILLGTFLGGELDPETIDGLDATSVERLRRGVELVGNAATAGAPIGGEREKDRTILQTIERLDLPALGWIVDDPWEADLLAIGVRSDRNADRLVYISTYYTVPGRYCFDGDESSPESDLGYVTLAHGEDVTFDELLAAMRAHLDGESE